MKKTTTLFALKQEELSMAPDYFTYLIYGLFWGLPIFSVLWFAVALFRYLTAKRQIKRGKRQYSEADMKRRKLQLIISSVLFGVVAVIAVSLFVLLLLAVAFM